MNTFEDRTINHTQVTRAQNFEMNPSLKTLIQSADLEFLMEAHNGLSAKIVAETGFKGIWASGLTMSSSLGLRDCNEASWSEVLQQVEYMRDSVEIPILLDGDSGFGDFNNVRRLVEKLEKRGVDGICIEDKVFPKRNSFMKTPQQLADVEEFSGKLKAAKDTQKRADFCVVARLEGFIAGASQNEVLTRAHLYQEAGADALLVHSKLNDAQQILGFAEQWQGNAPLIIVPTTYCGVATDDFRHAGISVAIWANHTLRASIAAMQAACLTVFEEQSVAAIESSITSIDEIMRIQNCDELYDAEKKYLPNSN